MRGEVGQVVHGTVEGGAVLGIGGEHLLVQKLHAAILVGRVGKEDIEFGGVEGFEHIAHALAQHGGILKEIALYFQFLGMAKVADRA